MSGLPSPEQKPAHVPVLHVEVDPRDYRTLADFVTDVLRRNIASGVLSPGSRLAERRLAAQLGVSRVPVREATRRLAQEGLVEVRPHGRGAVVPAASDTMLREILEIRTALEAAAAFLAALRRPPLVIDRLTELHDAGLARSRAGDFEASRQIGRLWHDCLWEASGNDELQRQLAAHDARLAWRDDQVLQARGTDTWEEHGSILEMVRGGDAWGAARAVTDHMRNHMRSSAVSFAKEAALSPGDGEPSPRGAGAETGAAGGPLTRMSVGEPHAGLDHDLGSGSSTSP